jgi:hypothetical protein
VLDKAVDLAVQAFVDTGGDRSLNWSRHTHCSNRQSLKPCPDLDGLIIRLLGSNAGMQVHAIMTEMESRSGGKCQWC